MAEIPNTSDSVVDSGASTSAESQPIETTVADTSSETTPEPISDNNADPWANLGEENAGDNQTEAQAAPDKPADTAKTASSPDDAQAEKSLEDQVLDEVFGSTGKDEPLPDDDDLDSPETAKNMIEGQPNAVKKAWMSRISKRAEIVKNFQFPDKETGEYKPIGEIADTWNELNPQRFNELASHTAHQLVDANPDAAFQRAFAVKMLSIDPNFDIRSAQLPTLEDVIANMNGNAAPTSSPQLSFLSSQQQDNDLAAITAELDSTIDWDWRDESLDHNFIDDREIALARSVRQLDAKAKSELSGRSNLESELQSMKKQLEALTGNAAAESNKVLEEDFYKSLNTFRESFEGKVVPYLVKSAGLDKSTEDTPKIAAFKDNLRLLYSKSDYEKANNLESAFESFATQESSVKDEIEMVYTRISNAKANASRARMNKDSAKADRFDRLADEERLSLHPLFAQANKEFIPLRIAPQMAVIGEFSSKVASPLREASERQEIVSNSSGSSSNSSSKTTPSSMSDVFDDVIANVARDEALRANA